MNKPIYLVLLATIIYYGCQKGIEDQPATNAHFTLGAKQWRLSGYMSDTSKYEDWDAVSYDPDYIYYDYYCVPTPADPPLNAEIYLSPYKCTVVKDGVYYFLPDSYCDWNRQPVLTDTVWYRNLTNDISFNTNGNFNLHISAERSKWIDWFNSTCSDIRYLPYLKSDYGFNGTWKLDSTANIITLTYENMYGVYESATGMFPDYGDTTVPKTEKWKIMSINDSTLSLNACLTCTADSGYRKLYKAL